MKRFLLYLLAIVTLVACTKSDDGGDPNPNPTPSKPKTEIKIETTASDFSSEGGRQAISFTTTEAWTAEVINSRADGWCSISPTSGAAGSATITVTTEPNDTPDDRSASIVIKAGSASKTVKVSQKQKDALTVTASTFEVGAEGGEVKIEVKANIDFEYAIEESAQEWIKYEGTRAMKTSNLVFEVKENDDIDKREAKITITSGEFSEVVTIYQEGGQPTITLTQNEFVVSSSAQAIAVEVKSNVDVTVEIPSDASWVKENTTRGVSTNTYYFDIAQNDNYDSRTAEIKFTNKDNGIFETVSITQSQKDAIVASKGSYSFGKKGGDLFFKIQTNADITVSISDNAQDWILHPTTRSMNVQSLYFEIATCNGEEIREGVITLTGGDAVQTIKVVQNPLATTGTTLIYKSSDGNVVTPTDASKFGATIVSNEYKDGFGVITFDDNVTAVGEHAFDGCTTLTYIELPEGITSVGDYAFANCSAMEYISLANTITSIGNYVFENCTGEILINCDIPDAERLNNQDIGTFKKSQFTKVVISDWVTTIGDYAFSGCSSITSITIPESVTEIGSYAFSGCSSITSITIPESVTKIGDSAFSGCSSITSLTIPESVTEIGGYAFYGCGRGELTVNCNSSDGAFYKANFTKVTIGDKVTKIGSYAFEGCSSLASITIPESVTKIGKGAFSGCSSLASITIPESVTEIGSYAFNGCSSLKCITIPESVIKIGLSAFAECTGEVIINCNTSGTNYYAFLDAKFAVVTIGDGVTEIASMLFYDNEYVKAVTIGAGVTSIGKDAFYDCSYLHSVYCMPTTPPALEDKYVFNYNAEDRKFYVPKASVSAYKANTNWSGYFDKIEGYEYDLTDDNGSLENPDNSKDDVEW